MSSKRRLVLSRNLVASELLDSFLGTVESSVTVLKSGMREKGGERTRRPKQPCKPSAKRRDQF